MISRYLNFSLLMVIIFGLSCSDGDKSSLPITDFYPLKSGSEWNYLLIDDNDTTKTYVDFDLSQLSDDSKTAVIEIYNIDAAYVFIFEAKDSGICLDLYEGPFEEAKSKINSIENNQCAALLKVPVSDGDNYEFSYTTSNNKNYTYNVSVSEEILNINGVNHSTFKYEMPLGTSSDGEKISEIYHNQDLGIVKFVGEHIKGTEPRGYLMLESLVVK